jgi:Ca2+-binding EF-hand superfamily protein
MEEKLLLSFKAYDADGNGFIDEAEMIQLFKVPFLNLILMFPLLTRSSSLERLPGSLDIRPSVLRIQIRIIQ